MCLYNNTFQIQNLEKQKSKNYLFAFFVQTVIGKWIEGIIQTHMKDAVSP